MKNIFPPRTAVATFALICVLVIAMLFLLRGELIQSGCRLQFTISESNDFVERLDQAAGNFSSTTTKIMGRSAEGGVQFTYTDNNARQIVEQRFYGETGRTYMRFYYNRGEVFALVK